MDVGPDRSGVRLFSEDEKCPKSIKIIVNGVPMAPHGSIFGQNEAHRFQEAF